MGTWYPTGMYLDSLLDSAYSEARILSLDNSKIRAIIVPHAGYVFCVKTSLNAFKNIDPTQYDRVFILGPSHHFSFPYCSIPNANSAETPYGFIPFDTSACEYLLNQFPKLFKPMDVSIASIEHSLEMEFPLLKYIFKTKPFSIIPIIVGSISHKACKEIAKSLSPYADDSRTLFVISSDFCHWGKRFGYQYLPQGNDLKIFQRIEKLDKMGADAIALGDPEKFQQYLDETGNTICGRNPILIMMNLFKDKSVSATFPSYSQSENITSMSDSSVSYYAGIITIDE